MNTVPDNETATAAWVIATMTEVAQQAAAAKTLAPAQVLQFAAALSHPRAAVCDHAVSLIQDLQARGLVFDGLLLEMARSRAPTVRYAALSCLSEHVSPACARCMLEAGLKDQAAILRCKAVEMAERLGCKLQITATAKAAAVSKESGVRT